MTNKNRAMLIGSIGAGKSTLTNALLEKEVKVVKTQTLIYYDWIVDTPGEYTENPLFYKNIMATSLEVSHILYLQDATKKNTVFPHGYSLGLNKLPIGIVTKSDHERADILAAVAQLRKVIPKGPIVVASSVKKEGLVEIREFVKCNSLEEMKHYFNNHPSEKVFFK
ncbi:MAG: EutP/PduV family microcompartment system protein [Bacillota bacterium]|nr:EutP/PduV family microcompartment system protein [Bacillota bacterium]